MAHNFGDHLWPPARKMTSLLLHIVCMAFTMFVFWRSLLPLWLPPRGHRMPPTLMFCHLYLYRMNEIEISLFDPFKPMLADRPPASFDFDAVRTNQVWPLKQFHWFFTAWFFTHFCVLKISQGTPPDGVPWRSAHDKIEVRSFGKHSTLENTTASVIDLTFF